MANDLRWGILGAARFAAKDMAPAIHAARGNRLAALATTSPDKVAPFRAITDDLTVYDSYAALLDDDGIDAIYIPLANHLHVDWTLRAIEAGKHVLCEKPIALDAGEVDRIIAARDASGLHVAEAYMILHHPQWERVRALLDAGALGTLGHVDAVFTYNNPDRANFRNQRGTGGGGIRDVGVYTYGSARFATGAEPEEISTRIRWEDGVDVWAHTTGTMAGPKGRFTYSGLTSTRLMRHQSVTFHGSDGLLKLTAPFNGGVFAEAQAHLLRPDHSVAVERWPGVNQYVLQVENFAATVREGVPYPAPLEFSRGTQAMIDMVFSQATDIT